MFATVALIAALVFPTTLGQIAVIVGGGLCGWVLLNKNVSQPLAPLAIRLRRRTGGALLTLFFGLLVLLPVVASKLESETLQQFARFYRVGALVFGGGHVVLPLLQAEIVSPGWLSNDLFLAGYGIAQALPGPLFSFAAYLGCISKVEPSGWIGGFICLIAIFLPAFLLIVGVLPFWEKLRQFQAMQRALQGINAAVVGLLLSAFFNPV